MKEYDDNYKRGKVVVYCWASWCGPCVKQRPILERCEKHLKGVTFMSADFSHGAPLKLPIPDADIIVLPTIVMFNDGQLMMFTRPDSIRRPYISGLHTSVRDIVKTIRNIYRQNGVELER